MNQKQLTQDIAAVSHIISDYHGPACPLGQAEARLAAWRRIIVLAQEGVKKKEEEARAAVEAKNRRTEEKQEEKARRDLEKIREEIASEIQSNNKVE